MARCLGVDNPKYKHGLRNHRIYSIYMNMIQRCYNKNNPRWMSYGGRGILICDEWLNDVITFYNWAIGNGYDKSLTLDRIDNDKCYSPNNCKWSTALEQSSNTRKTVSREKVEQIIKLTKRGLSTRKIGKILGMPKTTVWYIGNKKK